MINTALQKSENSVKAGLALSGGGFRSAFFHIGVLACLAEMDLLRKINVLSSVSGGSIIAAYYYLKVKTLLEKKTADPQGAPGRDAYIRLVSEIESDFLAGVQKNMLIRTFLDPLKNARMLTAGFSNTERLAELLTRYFYQPIFSHSSPGGGYKDILLKDIAITPPPQRLPAQTQVPFLIINASTLNTGHLWQFTNTSVGEQPTLSETGDGTIEFLKKFRLDDERLTIEQRKILYHISLGQAVAASCGVPGILEPLQIRNLYKMNGQELIVSLADGGLVDNQGLASLFAENCSHIICSDASDILKPERQPSSQFLNMALRANDILMERIRVKRLHDLYNYGSGRFALFNMGDPKTRDEIFPADSGKLVQALTQIRTAMDSFTDIEAYALMYYGYGLSRRVLKNEEFEMLQDCKPTPFQWRFLEIQQRFFNTDARRKELLRHLSVGSRQMFKVFMLNKVLPFMILLPVPTVFFSGILYLIIQTAPMIFWSLLICFLLGLIYTQNQRILKIMDHISILRKMKHRILKTLISLRLPEPFSYLLSIISWIHLNVFDRLFLYYGRIRNVSDARNDFRRNG